MVWRDSTHSFSIENLVCVVISISQTTPHIHYSVNDLTPLRSVPGAVHDHDDTVAVVHAVEVVVGIGVVVDHDADGPRPVGDIACWKLS